MYFCFQTQKNKNKNAKKIGRKIEGHWCAEIICKNLVFVIEQSLLYSSLNGNTFKTHVISVEDQQWLRNQLTHHNLAAFVKYGAILPRKSGVFFFLLPFLLPHPRTFKHKQTGVNDRPLDDPKSVVPFKLENDDIIMKEDNNNNQNANTNDQSRKNDKEEQKTEGDTNDNDNFHTNCSDLHTKTFVLPSGNSVTGLAIPKGIKLKATRSCFFFLLLRNFAIINIVCVCVLNDCMIVCCQKQSFCCQQSIVAR